MLSNVGYLKKPEQRKREAKNKKDEEQVKRLSFLKQDIYLYEQIYENKQVAFIKYNTETGETSRVDYVLGQNGVKILPFNGEEVELGAVRLPSGIMEYKDTLTLLNEIEQHIYAYLDVSDSFRKFASYYVLLSWLFDRFNTLPYLRFLGDTGCGKSRALDVCGGLCYKPIIASGCITPAPIYRMLKRWGGTLILDEADLKNSDEYNEVITILNCGFERGRPVIRATKNDPDKLQFLPTFGPKVFATRRRFKDPALEARCLTEVMQETTRNDIPPVLNKKFYEEQETLRRKLLLFRLENYEKIDPEQAATVELEGIEPRLKQISGSFSALFANQPDVMSDYQGFIKEHQRELIEQRLATPTGQVVEALLNFIENVTVVTNETNVTGEKTLQISSKDIAEKVEIDITPQAVGQILKTLGLKTKVVKIGGKAKRCIVYDETKIETLKKRYIPKDDNEEGYKGYGGYNGYGSQCENDAMDNFTGNIKGSDDTDDMDNILGNFKGGEITEYKDVPF